jgi:hypothetical protein
MTRWPSSPSAALLGVPAALLGALLLGSPGPAGADDTKYTFSADWVNVGGRVADWTAALAPYKGRPDVHALEIGSFEGRSALWFLDHVLTDDSSTITCIDPFGPGYEATFDANVEASGRAHRVVKLKGLSSQVLRSLEPNSYDFIYIDGCHLASCAYLDAALSWDLLKVGGTMIFDDYVWALKRQAPGRPKLAIDAFVESFLPFIDVLPGHNHSLMLRKTRDSLDKMDASGLFGDTTEPRGTRRRGN